MFRNTRHLAFSALALCLLLGPVLAQTALAAETPADPAKRTILGKYLTSPEAYAMWRAAPAKVFVLDVRTVEEYDLVGHPEMAINVPLAVRAGGFDPVRRAYGMAANPRFVDEVRRRFGPGDTLLVICRSGNRSAAAVNLLARAGFAEVYNVVDGFEGDPVADKASPDYGKRVREGWRNSPLPWTTALDPRLVYRQ